MGLENLTNECSEINYQHFLVKSRNQNDCQVFKVKKRNSLILASLKRSHSNYFKLTLSKINNNNNLLGAIKFSSTF